MQCEICGKETELYTAIVEGAQLKICEKCAKFGRIISKPQFKDHIVEIESDSEKIELIYPDYSQKIKNAREKLGFTQEELAKKLSEKETMIHKLESGHLKPDIALARKLEKFLKIAIVENVSVQKEKTRAAKAENVTIGDLIKFK